MIASNELEKKIEPNQISFKLKEHEGEVIKKLNSRSNSRNFLYGMMVFTSSFIALPYVLPTALSKSKEYEKYNKQMESLEEVLNGKKPEEELKESTSKSLMRGSIAGHCTGLTITVAEAYAYSYFTFNGHPEVLLIPVVTNTLSFLYEKGRNVLSKGKYL